jgi:hypothetical protein
MIIKVNSPKYGEKEWMMMIKKGTDIEYIMQRYNYIWYLIKYGTIIDHNQYRNDLISKYDLQERAS